MKATAKYKSKDILEFIKKAREYHDRNDDNRSQREINEIMINLDNLERLCITSNKVTIDQDYAQLLNL